MSKHDEEFEREARNSDRRTDGKCLIMRLIEALPDDKMEAALKAMSRPNTELHHSVVANVLGRWSGRHVRQQGVGEHRRGSCCCDS